MSNYKLNEEKMFADVTDGTAIIINSETGIYYGINNFGTQIYESLTEGSSREDVLSALKSLKDVPSDIETTLDAFIKRLLDFEIIKKADTSSKAVNIDSSIAKSDNYKMLVNEYNDAQEMLLSDPIHEVKEEEGWSPNKDSIGYNKEETLKREEKAEE